MHVNTYSFYFYFNTLLTAPNSRFFQFFAIKRTYWEGGKPYDYDSLAEYTLSIYNNIVSNSTWDVINDKN